jgi:hypothetical protein
VWKSFIDFFFLFIFLFFGILIWSSVRKAPVDYTLREILRNLAPEMKSWNSSSKFCERMMTKCCLRGPYLDDKWWSLSCNFYGNYWLIFLYALFVLVVRVFAVKVDYLAGKDLGIWALPWIAVYFPNSWIYFTEQRVLIYCSNLTLNGTFTNTFLSVLNIRF